MVLQGRVKELQQESLALSRQTHELQSRAGSLDKDNQELQMLLANARRDVKIREDQLRLVRNQLGTTTSQLARLREERKRDESQVNALTASLGGDNGASPGGNGPLEEMPRLDTLDVHVRRDGDVIRVEIPSGRLFESGTANLAPDAENLITDVADEIVQIYPDQIIGVEGHTDGDPVGNSQWRNNHRLSVAQALEVYGVLSDRARLDARQLFVVGYGGNHPVVSNATYDGQQRNRRVELVVYPERYR
jgi:flagellar motor protein MotB